VTDPVTPDRTAEPAASPAAGTQAVALAAGWNRLDANGRTVVGGSLAVALVAIVGSVLGAWTLRGFGLVVLLAALAVALVAWLVAASTDRPAGARWPVAPAWLEVGGAVVAGSLAVLNVVELAADLDDLEDWGGPVGALLSVVMAVIAAVVLVAAVRRAGAASLGTWRSPRPVAIAGLGAALVLLGVGLGLLVGVVALGQTTSFNIAFALLAVVAVRAAVDPDGTTLPFPAGWLAAVLVVISLVFALNLVSAYLGANLDPVDWLFFLIHIAGLALVTWAALLVSPLPGRTAD
jgi:hypothetical protein